MGVHVHKARRHGAAVGIQGLPRRLANLPDCRDAAIPNAHIPGRRWGSGAIDDATVFDQYVQHETSLLRPYA